VTDQEKDDDTKALDRFGRALYGEAADWHARMATDLGVSIRTFRRWYAGELAIPAGVWADLGQRVAGLQELAAERRQAAEAAS
jgi:hypothetical protein